MLDYFIIFFSFPVYSAARSVVADGKTKKKRGFFSWLGFGEKEQETEQKTEEQQVVEEQSQPETPVETAAVVEAEEPAHSKEEIESFAEEVVEVTEQVQESEKPEPVIVETLVKSAAGRYRTRRAAAAGRG